jgi:AraC-like DNA-binding protein
MSTITAPATRRCGLAGSRSEHERVPARLARYTDHRADVTREIVSLRGAGGSTLVVDRLAGSFTDARLVAHLAADEPRENARIVCEAYLADETRGRCRRLSSSDFETDAPGISALRTGPAPLPDEPLHDADGFVYRICEVSSDGSFPELRWARSRDTRDTESVEPLSLREVVGRFEDYEPARTVTASALASHRDDRRLSITRLQGEFERVVGSPIVLNRALREAVHNEIARELTMSEIALRCGRAKKDRRGNVSGETSWLARRIGLLPEGGKDEPTPWIHSDVLALIAREGLGVCPREVEI